MMKYSNSATIPARTRPTRKPLPSSQIQARKPHVGKLIAVFEAKTVVVQAQPQHFGHNHEHQHVQEQGQAVVLKCGFVGDVAKSAAPSRGQQHNHEGQPEKKVGNAQPPPDAVVTPRLRRVGGDGTVAAAEAIFARLIIVSPKTKCETQKSNSYQCLPRFRRLVAFKPGAGQKPQPRRECRLRVRAMPPRHRPAARARCRTSETAPRVSAPLPFLGARLEIKETLFRPALPSF